MTRPPRAAALAFAVALLAGCGSGADSERDGMTPEDALTTLQKDTASILGAAGGTEETDFSEPEEIPCGGPGGNEFSKIKHSLDAGAGKSDGDADAVVKDVTAAMRSLGLEVSDRGVIDGRTTIDFRGEAYTGSFFLAKTGVVTVFAETACLDNPDD